MELYLLSAALLNIGTQIAQLENVQEIFQSYEYSSDQDLWDKSEYWAIPSELYLKGKGDCEDIALAKYFVLLKQGVPNHKLRLAYKLLKNGRVHMLLEYHHASHVYILDNHTNAVSLASSQYFEQQILSFNHENIWINQQLIGESQPRMKLWRDYLSRYYANEPSQNVALQKFLAPSVHLIE